MRKLGLLLLLFSGCQTVNLKEISKLDYFRTCVGGVYYLIFNSGVTIQVNPYGEPVLCLDEENEEEEEPIEEMY